ncbi:GcrA family cell cycle regulator [Pseudorhodoplanes sp.]|uniref:GcrA family cell cycle regulator n=1 Tax=Pseudorhodoplanes sp. TaxID=1934341 RepID=UPI00391ABAA1
MTTFVWSPEVVARLREHWQAGLSASQCARAINNEFGTSISRNAVIGKARRMRLPTRNYRTRQLPPTQWFSRGRPLRATRIALAVSPPPLISGGGVTTAELKPEHCRWPFGDPCLPGFRFCGARRLEPLSYCPAHALIAYRPAAKKRRAA